MSASLSKAPAKAPEMSEIERLKAQLALLQAAQTPQAAAPAAPNAMTAAVKGTNAPTPTPALAKEVSAMDMDAFLAKYQ